MVWTSSSAIISALAAGEIEMVYFLLVTPESIWKTIGQCFGAHSVTGEHLVQTILSSSLVNVFKCRFYLFFLFAFQVAFGYIQSLILRLLTVYLHPIKPSLYAPV